MGSFITDEKSFEEFYFKCEEEYSKGRYQEAKLGYLQLLQYRLRVNNQNKEEKYSSYDARIIERLGDLAWLFRDTKATDLLFKGLQLAALAANNHYLHTYMVIKRASLAVDAGLLDDAITRLNELEHLIGVIQDIPFDRLLDWEQAMVLPVANEEEDIQLKIRLYDVIGTLLMNFGQYKCSLLSLKRGLSLTKGRENLTNQFLIHLMKLNICQIHIEIGKLDQSKKQLNDLLPKLKKGIGSYLYIIWLELSAKQKMLSGAFGDAKSQLEEIYDLCGRKGFANAQTLALINLAQLNIFLNQVSKATDLLIDAEKIAKQWNDASILRRIKNLLELAKKRSVSSLSGVSIIPSMIQARRKGQSKHQQPELADSSTIYDAIQTGSFLSYYEDKEMVFYLLRGNYSFEKAQEYLEDMVEFFEKTDSNLIKNRLSFLKFLLAFDKGQRVFDTDKIKELHTYFKERQLNHELWNFQGYLSHVQNIDFETTENLKKDNVVLLQQMTANLRIDEQATFLLNKWTDEEEKFSLKIAQLELHSRKKKQTFFLLKPFRNLQILSRLEDLLTELENYKGLMASQALDATIVRQLTKKLGLFKRLYLQPKDHLDIHFLILPNLAFIIISGFKIFNYKIVELTRLSIREDIKRLHELMQESNDTRGAGARAKMITPKELKKEIEEITIKVDDSIGLSKMISELPVRIKRISFIPDDVFHGFPFSILPYKNKYLIESFAISISHKSMVSGFRGNKKKNSKNVLLVGLSYEQATDFAPLSGVFQEQKIIRELLSQHGYSIYNISDDTAEKGHILVNVEKKQLIHFACHGTFNPQKPDQSGLQLPNGEILSLRDIWQNPQFAEVEHITLSSCWGADNFILPNKWVLSLPETILRAGTRSVLGCYWEVSDSLVVPFVKVFYENMLVYPRDIALQKTQILASNNKLTEEKIETSNLFYWAGFNLYGDYRKF